MVMQLDRARGREDAKKHARLVAQVWLDPALKARLLSEPKDVLRDYGFDFPAATDVRVVDSPEITIEQAGGVIYVGLPAVPSGGLGDEDLCWTVRGSQAHTSSSDAHTSSNAPCGVSD